MPDRPWATWKRGKPITQIQVSRMLRGFDIKPENMRVGDKVPKGYHTYDIVAALSRYAPASEPLQSLHGKNENENDELESVFVAFRPATEKATRNATTDEAGLDRAHSAQQTDNGESGVKYRDGNGEIRHGGSID